jgi:glycosyltransferase involved in cell wall biosynthesis
MKVSVIIPCYNFGEFIEQSILSTINQITNFDYEILVRDDLSTDYSQINIERVGYYHPKVKYYTPTENLGFSRNISFLISEAKGEYIAYLDGDDYFTDPYKLQKQVDFLDNNQDYVMTFTGHWGREPNGGYAPDSISSWLGLIGFKNDEVTTSDLLIANYVTFGRMFRNVKNIVQDWMMDLPYFDWPLNYELSKHGKIKFLNYPMGVYRYHNNSVFSLLPIDKREEASLSVKEKILENHIDYESYPNL